jgi:uncharacterized protein (DUF2147 family)
MRFFASLSGFLLTWLALVASAATQPAAAPVVSAPIQGVWAQTDDKTGKLQSLVRIVESKPGRYDGFVEKLYPAPGEDPNPRCEDCKGALKNQPVLGMKIISDLKAATDDRDVFHDGEILDPDSGDVYRLKITVLEGGKKLDVRGFIGISLFGRSQIWRRVEKP